MFFKVRLLACGFRSFDFAQGREPVERRAR